jgi:hypothetical protein
MTTENSLSLINNEKLSSDYDLHALRTAAIDLVYYLREYCVAIWS